MVENWVGFQVRFFPSYNFFKIILYILRGFVHCALWLVFVLIPMLFSASLCALCSYSLALFMVLPCFLNWHCPPSLALHKCGRIGSFFKFQF
jgi:hypothetical protein